MNTIIRAIIIFVILAGLPILAKAENWASVDGLEGQYIDLDSASRNGDLATIKMRRLISGFGRKEILTFDCVRETLETNDGVVPVPKELELVLVKACKRSYEFWKYL